MIINWKLSLVHSCFRPPYFSFDKPERSIDRLHLHSFDKKNSAVQHSISALLVTPNRWKFLSQYRFKISDTFTMCDSILCIIERIL
jgi:hypothetical protein